MTKFQKKKCLEAAEQKTSKLLVVVCCCKTVDAKYDSIDMVDENISMYTRGGKTECKWRKVFRGIRF